VRPTPDSVCRAVCACVTGEQRHWTAVRWLISNDAKNVIITRRLHGSNAITRRYGSPAFFGRNFVIPLTHTHTHTHTPLSVTTLSPPLSPLNGYSSKKNQVAEWNLYGLIQKFHLVPVRGCGNVVHVPTQHARPPGFCHCWSVRVEQSSGPCPQSELHRSCFQAPAKDTFVRMVLAHLAHYGGGGSSI